MKRVLLSGGGGAIGSHVLAYILEKTDWHVTVLDSFRHKGYKERIDEVMKYNPEWQERVTTLQHDLVCSISPQLKEAIGRVNYVLHLAALSDVFFSVENPVYTIRNNIESTLTMLEYARHTSHDAFVYFSTDEVYGPVKKGEAHPEWDTHRPSNAYAASKAASEDICYAYWRSGYVRLVLTNTMNNYSEMQSPSKFPAMVQRKLRDGETVVIHGNEQEIGTRFYIHSRNVADALLHILATTPNEHKQGEIDDPDRYHIVGEACLDNLEMAQTIASLMGRKLDYELVDFHKDNPAHDIHYGLQDNRLRASGWKQPRSFEDSMKDTIDWQVKHPEWLE